MEWWNILVAVFFVIGVTAYPGWNFILRLELSYGDRIKIITRPPKQNKSPSKQFNRLEKIFGF